MIKNEFVPVMLFTGAGASCAKAIGLPNMTQFFKQIMDKNHNPTDSLIKQKSYFKYVMDRLYPNANENTVYDLEHVLGTLYKLGGTFSDDAAFSILNERTLIERIGDAANSEFYRQIRQRVTNLQSLYNAIESAFNQRYDEIKQSAKNLLYELQMVIRKTYSSVNVDGIYQVYGELFKEILALLSQFINNERQVVFPIFTTNYDPSIDYVLRPSVQKECIDKHKTWRKNVVKYEFTDGFTLHEYGGVIVWRQKAFTVECKDGVVIPYHKLHGSANWEKRNDEVMLTTDPVSDLNEMPRDFNMIYPSDKTTPDYDPYSFSHYELDRFLKKGKVLIVIGFAFRDPGIVNLFQRGLRENPDLKILVIGPEPNDWENELDRFLKLDRVYHINGYFGEQEVTIKLLNNLKNILSKEHILETKK